MNFALGTAQLTEKIKTEYKADCTQATFHRLSVKKRIHLKAFFGETQLVVRHSVKMPTLAG